MWMRWPVPRPILELETRFSSIWLRFGPSCLRRDFQDFFVWTKFFVIVAVVVCLFVWTMFWVLSVVRQDYEVVLLLSWSITIRAALFEADVLWNCWCSTERQRLAVRARLAPSNTKVSLLVPDQPTPRCWERLCSFLARINTLYYWKPLCV